MTRLIDLRSDTVSRPTPAMRAAMAAAEVGDDVFGDDPTVNRLEAVAAERVGKQAAMYVPSGTMANLLAVMTHTRPGEEILLGDQCHVFAYEVAGAARLGGLLTHPLKNLPDGTLAADDIRQAIREPGLHTPKTSLLCLENTHNRCGGAAIPGSTVAALAGVAHAGGLRVHLDGARLFNAQTALETPAAALAASADSVSFCLSKGLGCPVGSLLCGTKDYIAEARRNRKMLGGGMRQAGILAAAGLYALDHHIDRLADDHARAAALAKGLATAGPFRPNTPQTNIVVADVTEGTQQAWIDAFRAKGVLATPFGPGRFRMVTHLDITDDDVHEALRRIAAAAGEVR
ncbi:MAG: low-specificity L-threonine aldolase [Dehalococcoidia bacterium]